MEATPSGHGGAAAHCRKAFALLPRLTEVEEKALQNAATAPLDEAALGLVRRGEAALRELLQGAARQRADPESGSSLHFEPPFDVTTPVFPLGQLVCLRARLALQQGEGRAAVEDLGALLVLARQVGRGGPYLGRLAQFGVESLVLNVAAAHLPRLDAPALEALAARLASLPEAGTLADTVRREKQYLLLVARPQLEAARGEDLPALLRQGASESEVEAILRAAGPDPDGLLRLLDAMSMLYDELGPILMLPPGQFPQALAAFRQRHQVMNPLVVPLVRHAEAVGYAAARADIRLAMLKFAVARFREHVGRPMAPGDLVGDGPFVCRPFKGGFELESWVRFPGQPPITLTVGREEGVLARLRCLWRRLVGRA